MRMNLWPKFGLDSRSVMLETPETSLSISRAHPLEGAVFHLDFCLVRQITTVFREVGKNTETDRLKIL